MNRHHLLLPRHAATDCGCWVKFALQFRLSCKRSGADFNQERDEAEFSVSRS